MWVEDSHAVGQAEPGLNATICTRPIAVQGPEHQSLPYLRKRHQRQRLLRIICLGEAGRIEMLSKQNKYISIMFPACAEMTLKLSLACLEEVSLSVVLRIIGFLWSEEEAHGTHLSGSSRCQYGIDILSCFNLQVLNSV